MAAILTMPRNESVLRDFGPYPGELNIGEGSTNFQNDMRTGLWHFEPGTQATLLTLVQLASGRPIEFFDVGAHIGLHSLLIASIFPPERVHVTAFEPTPRTAALCRSLAGTNQLQVRIERCAVSEATGTAQLYISPWETSNSLQAGFREALEEITVPVVSLDSYCAEHDLRPSVIKIDVESYETPVLLGARETLAATRAPVVCEILADTDRDRVAEGVSVLADLDYVAHRWVRDEGWVVCSTEDIVQGVEHVGNDWLFTGQELDDRFTTALAAWRAAIAACTADTTVIIDTDETTRRPSLYEPSAAG